MDCGSLAQAAKAAFGFYLEGGNRIYLGCYVAKLKMSVLFAHLFYYYKMELMLIDGNKVPSTSGRARSGKGWHSSTK